MEDPVIEQIAVIFVISLLLWLLGSPIIGIIFALIMGVSVYIVDLFFRQN